MRRRDARAVFLGVCVLACGCVEERVVHYKPFMSSIPGAQTGMPVVDEGERVTPDVLAPVDRIRVEDEDGEITLYTKSCRDLIRQIAWALERGEAEALFEQVLAERTQKEFKQRDLGPEAAMEMLLRRERDLRRLFSRMPQGEYTPGITRRRLGEGVYRMEVPVAGGLRVRWIDVLFEDGNWRLVWFGPA